MKLKNVTLTNGIQVSISESITAIVGPNNAGKCTFLREIQQVFARRGQAFDRVRLIEQTRAATQSVPLLGVLSRLLYPGPLLAAARRGTSTSLMGVGTPRARLFRWITPLRAFHSSGWPASWSVRIDVPCSGGAARKAARICKASADIGSFRGATLSQ